MRKRPRCCHAPLRIGSPQVIGSDPASDHRVPRSPIFCSSLTCDAPVKITILREPGSSTFEIWFGDNFSGRPTSSAQLQIAPSQRRANSSRIEALDREILKWSRIISRCIRKARQRDSRFGRSVLRTPPGSESGWKPGGSPRAGNRISAVKRSFYRLSARYCRAADVSSIREAGDPNAQSSVPDK